MNRIGGLVELEGGSEQICTDVAMHVAAMSPPYATAADVPAAVLEKEKEILSAQALDSGKPPEIVEKMVEGRIRKYLEEICLVSQNFVKDGDKTVNLRDKCILALALNVSQATDCLVGWLECFPQ